jgi:hypothetical protein
MDWAQSTGNDLTHRERTLVLQGEPAFVTFFGRAPLELPILQYRGGGLSPTSQVFIIDFNSKRITNFKFLS